MYILLYIHMFSEQLLQHSYCRAMTAVSSHVLDVAISNLENVIAGSPVCSTTFLISRTILNYKS